MFILVRGSSFSLVLFLIILLIGEQSESWSCAATKSMYPISTPTNILLLVITHLIFWRHFILCQIISRPITIHHSHQSHPSFHSFFHFFFLCLSLLLSFHESFKRATLGSELEALYLINAIVLIVILDQSYFILIYKSRYGSQGQVQRETYTSYFKYPHF